MYLAFEHPVNLWYLLVVPLIIVTHYAFLKYTRRRALKFANFQALKRVTDEKVITKNHLQLILRCLIIISLILAIAGTTLWYKGTSNNNNFVVALDTSSSMTAQDFKPSRIEAAKDYIITIINNLDSDATLGVLTFSGTAFIEHLPSTNKGEIKDAVLAITPAPVGGTDIAGAIVTASNMLIASDKGKVMILITDGSNTVSFFTKDPVNEAVSYAKSNNIIIYTIGLGTETSPIGYLPEYYNISSVFNGGTLEKISNQTGGKYYYAANNKELDITYKDILSNTKEAYLPIKFEPILMVVALILLIIEWGLINTRFRSIP